MGSLFDLSGRVALVTGATSGIGQRQAIALAQAGASVVLLGRREAELEQTAQTIHADGGQAAALPADLFDRDKLSQYAGQAAGFFGSIDILVNAAGVNFRQPVEQISFDSWDKTINLNLAVPFFLARELVPAGYQTVFRRGTGSGHAGQRLGPYYQHSIAAVLQGIRQQRALWCIQGWSLTIDPGHGRSLVSQGR